MADELDPRASQNWMRDIQIQQRRGNEENGVLRNMYKKAKSEGESVDDMRAVLRMLKSKTSDEILVSLRNQIRYLMLRSVQVTASDLFEAFEVDLPNSIKHNDDIWEAEDKGYRAGRNNVEIKENPYGAGSENFVHWEEHWHKGQASIAREMGPDALVNTTRTRPRSGGQARIPGTEERQLSPRKAAANGNGRKSPAKKKAGGKRRGRPPGKRAALPAPGTTSGLH